MRLAFMDGRVFVGNGEVVENASVLVEDDKIVSIVNDVSQIPDDTQKIPIGNNTLFPGFIDCHVHLAMNGDPDPLNSLANDSVPMATIKAAKNAEKTLAAGVTTVRDLGGSNGIDLGLKQAVSQGLIRGPRILVSAQLICMTGGHGWPIGREADGPDEVRKAAREQIKAGADQIKMMATGGVLTPGVEPGCPQLTYEELKAGVEEAQRADKKTATHAMGSKGIMDALKAGIDSIEHGIYLNQEIISFMKENRRFFVPTIAALHNIEEAGIEGGIPDWAVKKTAVVAPHHRKSIIDAHDAGVAIAMGTDAGTPYNYHGNNLVEIVLLASHGLTTMEALMAATSVAAEVVGLEDKIGTIEPGKFADLVLVRDNPLKDIKLLNNADAIIQVVKDGKLIKNDL